MYYVYTVFTSLNPQTSFKRLLSAVCERSAWITNAAEQRDISVKYVGQRVQDDEWRLWQTAINHSHTRLAVACS